METSNNTGKMIGALLLGAAIGGVLGVLFAPDKGSETRKKIAGKTGDLTQTLKDKLNTLLTELQSAREKAQDVIETNTNN